MPAEHQSFRIAIVGRPNVGKSTLFNRLVGQRLAHDVTDYPRLAKRLYRNGGEWNLVDHADIEFVKR